MVVGLDLVLVLVLVLVSGRCPSAVVAVAAADVVVAASVVAGRKPGI